MRAKSHRIESARQGIRLLIGIVPVNSVRRQLGDVPAQRKGVLHSATQTWIHTD